MLVAFDLVEQENRSVPVRKLFDGVGQCDPVDASGQRGVSGSVLSADLGAVAIAVRFVQRNLAQRLLAKVH